MAKSALLSFKFTGTAPALCARSQTTSAPLSHSKYLRSDSSKLHQKYALLNFLHDSGISRAFMHESLIQCSSRLHME